MPILFRDYETRSTLKLGRVGAWRYASDPATDVICIAFAMDDGPVETWLRGQPIPDVFHIAADDPDWLVCAHNDAFERAIEQHILAPRYGFPLVPIERHRCTMAMALAAALPGGIDEAAASLGLPTRKDKDGAKLMSIMALPREPATGEDPNELHWYDDDERLERLCAYCAQDVAIQRELYRRLPPLSEIEQ